MTQTPEMDKKYLWEILGISNTKEFNKTVYDEITKFYIKRTLNFSEKLILSTMIHKIYCSKSGKCEDDYVKYFPRDKTTDFLSTKCCEQTFETKFSDELSALYISLECEISEIIKTIIHNKDEFESLRFFEIIPICIFTQSLVEKSIQSSNDKVELKNIDVEPEICKSDVNDKVEDTSLTPKGNLRTMSRTSSISDFGNVVGFLDDSTHSRCSLTPISFTQFPAYIQYNQCNYPSQYMVGPPGIQTNVAFTPIPNNMIDPNMVIMPTGTYVYPIGEQYVIPDENGNVSPIAKGLRLFDLYPDWFKMFLEEFVQLHPYEKKNRLLEYYSLLKVNRINHPIHIPQLLFYAVVNTRLESLYKILGHVDPLELQLPNKDDERAFDVFTALFSCFIDFVHYTLLNIDELSQCDEIHKWLEYYLVDPNDDREKCPFQTYYRFGFKKEKGRFVVPKIKQNQSGIIIVSKQMYDTGILSNLGNILSGLDTNIIPSLESLRDDDVIKNDPWINLCVLVSKEMNPFIEKFREEQIKIHRNNIEISKTEENYIPNQDDPSKKTNFLPEKKFPKDFIDGIWECFNLHNKLNE